MVAIFDHGGFTTRWPEYCNAAILARLIFSIEVPATPFRPMDASKQLALSLNVSHKRFLWTGPLLGNIGD